MELSLGQISPYRKQKYQEIITFLSEEKLIKTLDIILSLQQKISGVWDYKSLFLKSVIDLKELK